MALKRPGFEATYRFAALAENAMQSKAVTSWPHREAKDEDEWASADPTCLLMLSLSKPEEDSL